MDKELEEFREEVNKNLKSIYSKINEEEKEFLSYVVETFNILCERNNKAIDIIQNDTDLNSERQRNRLLNILKGEE